MKWRNRQQSTNVDDRRGQSGSGGRRSIGGGKIGIGTIVIAIIIYFMGGNPMSLFEGQVPSQAPQENQAQQGNDELGSFVKVVLKDCEEVWKKTFADAGKVYQEPTLVLFTGSTRSACGNASASTGPFYCPADQKLYIDLSFYQELSNRFGASGDFAMAYVVAHEVGHHVQHLIGNTTRVHKLRGRVSEAEYNRESVKLELQADFFAGYWAHHAHKRFNILEKGDIEEALNAARAIGDDRLQKQAQGYAVEESFTHGTSAQRMYWFRRGWETGDINKGDTFSEIQ